MKKTLLILTLVTCIFAGKHSDEKYDIVTIEPIFKPGPILEIENSLFYSTSEDTISRLICLHKEANFNHSCGYHWYVNFWKDSKIVMRFPINVECQNAKFWKANCGNLFSTIVNAIEKTPAYFSYRVYVPKEMSPDTLMNTLKQANFIPLIYDRKDNHKPSITLEQRISRPICDLKNDASEEEIKKDLKADFEAFKESAIEHISEVDYIMYPLHSFGKGNRSITGIMKLILKSEEDLKALKKKAQDAHFGIYEVVVPEELYVDFISINPNIVQVTKEIVKIIPNAIDVE